MSTAVRPVPAATGRSRTFHRLSRLRALLVVATVLATTGSAVALGVSHTDASGLRTATAPAARGAAAARAALVTAHTAALTSLASDAAADVGPGVEYRNEIAGASRQLASVAEAGVGGPQTAQAVQLAQGLVVSYMGYIEQARVYAHDDADSPLVTAFLQYASSLLFQELLPQLDRVATAAAAELDTLTGIDTRRAAVHAGWLGTVLLLLGLLAFAQLSFARRFRRTLSIPLLLATGLAVVLGASAAAALRADGAIDDAGGKLTELVGGFTVEAAAQQAAGCMTLDEMSRAAELGDAQVTACRAPERPAGEAVPDDERATAAAEVERHAITAERAGSIRLIVLLGVAIAALVIAGTHHRIEEYRYRPL